MRKRINIMFSGFAAYHDPHRQAYYRFLCDRYDVNETNHPDYVIDGGLNFRHLKHNAVKILLTSENIIPDFNIYDYAVGSTPLAFGDRYARIPWFVFYPHFAELGKPHKMCDDELLNRDFCSFVVSNAEFGDPIRRQFFERLSEYKPIASGGAWRNSVGGPIADKLSFCRGYKFNIAFENCAYPGYTTEKLMDAYVSETIPIYYGNPHVEHDFCPDSMVLVRDRSDIERAVEEIIRLDNDDDAYLNRIKAPNILGCDYEARLESFLAGIFDQPLESARRVAEYGYQASLRQHLKIVYGVDQFVRDLPGYDLGIKLLATMRAKYRGLA